MIGTEPHILVVDDDTRLRDLLQRYLSRSGFRVTAAASAAEARAKLQGFSFDLIVLDVMMPGESGLELTASIRQSNQVPILLLTAMDETSDRITGFESGADDYLGKPFEPRELVLRIEAILRRNNQLQSGAAVARFGDCQFDIVRGELLKGDQPLRLTSNEVAFLRVFSRNPGATVPREELVQNSAAGNIRAVDVQITRLRRKIEPDPKEPKYLQTVWGQGYVFWPDTVD